MLSRILIAGILLIGVTSSDVMADDKKGWKVLGQTIVSEGVDRTQLMINAKKGTFRQIRVQVKKAPVEIERLILHFDSNEKQVVWLKDNYEEGSWSRVVNVKGGKRAIKKVVFWYSGSDSGDEKPVVFLWGRQ